MLADHLVKTKKELKKVRKEVIEDIFIKSNFNDLPKRTAADKALSDEVFNIDKSPKYDGYQRGLDSVVDQFFDNKSSSNTSGGAVRNETNNVKTATR